MIVRFFFNFYNVDSNVFLHVFRNVCSEIEGKNQRSPKSNDLQQESHDHRIYQKNYFVMQVFMYCKGHILNSNIEY